MRLGLILLLFFCARGEAWTLVGGSIRGWKTTELTVRVNPTDCTIPQAELEDAVDDAIDAWNSVPTANLRLSRGETTTTVADFLGDLAPDTPVILCDPNLGTTLGTSVNNIPGVTVKLAADPHLNYGGILLNAQAGQAAEISNLDELALRLTIAHELGHVLGLGHSSVEEALMYYDVGSKTELLVTEDDRDGLSFLYPARFGCAAVKGTSGPGRPLTFFAVVAIWLVAVVRAGRLVTARRATRR